MIMDLKNLNLKTVKSAALMLAILIGIAGVASHYLGHDYVALGLIIIAALVIFIGSLLQLYLFNNRKFKDIN
jgi:uncharacterized membrane protein YfcA